MAKALPAAQRRAVAGSDPATGRLSAPTAVCAALVAAGLAVPHGRGGHHAYYLTTQGLGLRDGLRAAEASGGTVPPPAAPPADTGFTADDGTGAAPSGGPGRAAEVAGAWEGLLQIRAVLLEGATDAPAPWERERPVHAVALTLEAAGCPPAAPGSAGYRVTAAAEPGMAEITWSAPASDAAALAKCSELLGSWGWQCTAHRGRDGRAFLVVSPRR